MGLQARRWRIKREKSFLRHCCGNALDGENLLSSSTRTIGPEELTAVAEGQELTEVSCIPAEWLLSGEAETRSKLLAKTPDRLASIIMWECGAACFQWHYAVDESYVVLSGEAFVTDENGEERLYQKGDVAYFSAGERAMYRVPDHLRKVAFVKQPVWLPFAYAQKGWQKLLRVAGFSSKGKL